MRCDVNVSVKLKDSQKLGTKVEIKNVNSFGFVKEALEYEIERQIEKIKRGDVLKQETRGYDPATKKTFVMREKEFAHDYRYFPEPDLLPIFIEDSLLAEAKEGIRELPDQMKKRFEDVYKITEYAADILTSNRSLAEFFEDLARQFEDKKLLANFVLEEVLRAVNEGLCDLSKDSQNLKVVVKDILSSQIKGELSRNLAKEAFREVVEGRADVKTAIEKRRVLTDYSEIEKVVQKVIESNPKEVQRYRSGEKKLLGFFVGQANKLIKADPKLIMKIIQEKLEKD